MCFTRRVYFWGIIKILPLSPQPPFPPGKGETLGYFMQGASPLASPGLKPGRRWLFSAVSVLLCPYPPYPLPGGKGETLGYFMQGASPLASPGRSRGGTGSTGAGGAMRYEPGGAGYGRKTGHPAGAYVFYSPGLFLVYHKDFAPIPPAPLPGGKGEIFGFLMQGASPLASPGRSPGGAGFFLPCQCFFAPIPPTPFPAGRGRLYTLFRRGLTPPAPLRNKPARRWLRAGNKVPSGAWGAMGERRGGRRRPAEAWVGRWGRRTGKGCPAGHYFLFYTRFRYKVLERRGYGGGKLLSRSFPPPEHPGTPKHPIAARDTEGGQRYRRG